MKTWQLIVRNQMDCYCGPTDGGKYDLTIACPVCGTGARRVDPIHLPSARLRKSVSITLDHELVIPPRLVPALRDIIPHCLREILTEKTGAPTPYFEMIPEITLPGWSLATTGWCTSRMDPPCPTCKRDGYYNIGKTPLLLAYAQGLPPFLVAETYECFGNSGIQSDFKKSHFAVGLPVVCEAVRNVLAGERGLEFLPVSTLGNQ
jgi:hypothetical protein